MLGSRGTRGHRAKLPNQPASASVTMRNRSEMPCVARSLHGAAEVWSFDQTPKTTMQIII